LDACIEHGITGGGVERWRVDRGLLELGTYACGLLLCDERSACCTVCVGCLSVSNKSLLSQLAGEPCRLFKCGSLLLGKLVALALERRQSLLLQQDGSVERVGGALDLRHAVLLLQTLRVFLRNGDFKTFLFSLRVVEGGGGSRGLARMALVGFALSAQQRRAFFAEA